MFTVHFELFWVQEDYETLRRRNSEAMTGVGYLSGGRGSCDLCGDHWICYHGLDGGRWMVGGWGDDLCVERLTHAATTSRFTRSWMIAVAGKAVFSSSVGGMT